MTGSQLLTKALSLNGETIADAKISTDIAISMINLTLYEAFEINNQWRLQNSKEVLIAPQQITSLNDELLYEDKLLKHIMPYGVVAKLIATDEDKINLSMVYESKYANLLNSTQKPKIVVVIPR